MMQELYTFNIINTYDHKPLKGELKREEMESLLELIIRNEEERKKFLNNEKERDAVKIIEEAAEKHGIVDTEIYEKAFRDTLEYYFFSDETNPFRSEKELLTLWRKEVRKYKNYTIKELREEWEKKKEEFKEKGINTPGDYLKALFSYYIHNHTVKTLAHKLYEKEIEEFEKSIKPKILTKKVENFIDALIQHKIRFPHKESLRKAIIKVYLNRSIEDIEYYKFFGKITEKEYNKILERYNKLINNNITQEDYKEVEISDEILERISTDVASYSHRTGEKVATEKVLSNGEVPLQIVEDFLTKKSSVIFTLYYVKEMKKGYYNKLSEKARKELNRLKEW